MGAPGSRESPPPSESAGEISRRCRRPGKLLLQLSYSGCPPAPGLDLAARPKCREFNEGAARFLQDHPGIDTVFVASPGRPLHRLCRRSTAQFRHPVTDDQRRGISDAALRRAVLMPQLPAPRAIRPRLVG